MNKEAQDSMKEKSKNVQREISGRGDRLEKSRLEDRERRWNEDNKGERNTCRQKCFNFNCLTSVLNKIVNKTTI